MEKSTRSRGLFIAAGVCVLAYAVALCFAMYSLWTDGTYGWATTLLFLLQRFLPIPITFAFALIFKQTPQTITFILIAQELQLFFGFLHDIVPPCRLDVYAIRSSLLPLIAYGILLLSSALAGSKTRQRLAWPALLSPVFALVCLILNIRGDSRLEYRIVYIIEFISILLTGLAICFSTASARQPAPASLNGRTADAAEQIKTYKSLLDQGVLTQEEYDRKKSELPKL